MVDVAAQGRDGDQNRGNVEGAHVRHTRSATAALRNSEQGGSVEDARSRSLLHAASMISETTLTLMRVAAHRPPAGRRRQIDPNISSGSIAVASAMMFA